MRLSNIFSTASSLFEVFTVKATHHSHHLSALLTCWWFRLHSLSYFSDSLHRHQSNVNQKRCYPFVHYQSGVDYIRSACFWNHFVRMKTDATYHHIIPLENQSKSYEAVWPLIICKNKNKTSRRLWNCAGMTWKQIQVVILQCHKKPSIIFGWEQTVS